MKRLLDLNLKRKYSGSSEEHLLPAADSFSIPAKMCDIRMKRLRMIYRTWALFMRTLPWIPVLFERYLPLCLLPLEISRKWTNVLTISVCGEVRRSQRKMLRLSGGDHVTRRKNVRLKRFSSSFRWLFPPVKATLSMNNTDSVDWCSDHCLAKAFSTSPLCWQPPTMKHLERWTTLRI